MHPLASQSYNFDPRPRYPLLSEKRYWDPSSPHLDDRTASTLIFAHGTGFHKEQYEPMIQDLYNDLPFDGPKIREVWSIDAPNHGDSAVLNEEALRSSYESQEYSRGLHALLGGLGTGIDVEFSEHRFVLIGHCMGAVVDVFALNYQPELEPEFLIMVDIMGLTTPAAQLVQNSFMRGSAKRRDVWPSCAEAYRLLKARPVWRTWDDRVLRIICGRFIQATYRGGLADPTVYSMMKFTVQRFPTHFIDGAISDFLPRAVKDEFLAEAIGGVQNLASFTLVPDAGHLVVQTHPTALAKALFTC